MKVTSVILATLTLLTTTVTFARPLVTCNTIVNNSLGEIKLKIEQTNSGALEMEIKVNNQQYAYGSAEGSGNSDTGSYSLYDQEGKVHNIIYGIGGSKEPREAAWLDMQLDDLSYERSLAICHPR